MCKRILLELGCMLLFVILSYSCSKEDSLSYADSMVIHVSEAGTLFDVLVEKGIIGENKIFDEDGSHYEVHTKITKCTITGSLNDADWRLFSQYTFCPVFDFKSVQTETIHFSNNMITSITLPDNITSIGKSAFDECTSLKSVNIPDNVVSIGGFAFENTGIKSITIPNSVNVVEVMMLGHCAYLKEIHSKMTNIPSFIGASKYFICGTEDVNDEEDYGTAYSDCILYIPVGTLYKYRGDELWGRFDNIVEE